MDRSKAGRFDWQVYFASREWAVLKEKVRARSCGRCERCGIAPYEQTHHLNYKRPGRELLSDLMAVCAACHEYLSAKRKDDPRTPLRHRVSLSFRPEWNDNDQVHCPACGYEYVHFGTPQQIDSHDDYKARPEFVRGDVIVIPMSCEAGHSFDLEIGFHKGGTFVRWNPVWLMGEADAAIRDGAWPDEYWPDVDPEAA